MALGLAHLDLSRTADAESVRAAIVAARRVYLEEPGLALSEAIRCHEVARSFGDAALCARARALQGSVSLHRGDLRGALELVVEAERHADVTDDLAVQTELAALKAQLAFFTGSYAEALSHAELAVALSDQTNDLGLRIYARRTTCPAFGNLGVRDLRRRVDELLALTIEAGDEWEEAISRNDLACYLLEVGDLDGAEREIDRALRLGRVIRRPHRFALAIVHATRSEILLAAGRAEESLGDAERAIALLTENAEPNPYVLGVTVRVEVQARMALGQLDDARQSGEGALTWLGDRVPQTRSLILSAIAEALREAGRLEEAYDALARSAELERQAFRELSELQLRLERATLETAAARTASDALAVKNRQLAEAHAELERRANRLEHLQDQLRDQAERDWLTGLHNRRYLARELRRIVDEAHAVPLSLAVIDLDRFKSINDRFGHVTGDRVLVRVARLLGETLRECDLVVRSGGEEFLIVMPSTAERAATACCERIRAAIQDEPWDRIAGGLRVTASAGVATAHAPDELDAVIKLADQRMYAAKHAGRDRVFGARPEPPVSRQAAAGVSSGRSSSA